MSQQATANPKWSAAQVSEYLAKWQVEEVVQQAVNSAIRHKPDDPVLHIADFLEARGRAIEQQSQKSTDTQPKGRDTAASTLLAVRLDEPRGAAAAEDFFANACHQPVALVDGEERAAKHQFGNTNSGLKASGDLRTLHIVNMNTVRALADAAGMELDPRRFRPNIILDGSLPPFAEFGWVGGTVRVGEHVTLRVIKRTVRCEAVTLWAPDADREPLRKESPADGGDQGEHADVPRLLNKHFPEHGPYLGVYAQVEGTGTICIGDAVVPLPRVSTDVTAPGIPWVWRILCGMVLALSAAYALVVYCPAL